MLDLLCLESELRPALRCVLMKRCNVTSSVIAMTLFRHRKYTFVAFLPYVLVSCLQSSKDKCPELGGVTAFTGGSVSNDSPHVATLCTKIHRPREMMFNPTRNGIFSTSIAPIALTIMFGKAVFSTPLRLTSDRSIPPIRHLHTFLKRPNPRQAIAIQSRRAPFQRRHAGSFTTNFRTLFYKNPLTMGLAVVGIIVGSASILYANYIYQHYIVRPYHNYPEPVAKKLRRAVYYTRTDVQPKEAVKYYRQALTVAEESGMDPFSDEVIGIKIQVAALMESIGQWPKAVEVLERVRTDNLEWLKKLGGLDRNKEKRTKVLGKTVAITVKLGELYGHPAIFDRDLAEERLVWAVETVLREQQRRIRDNVTEEAEGRWMTNEEIGGAIESLAHNYEVQDQHYLATPLFLQALALYPTKDCHSVVLMNNVASSLAQQSPRAARDVQAYVASQNINERPTGPMAVKEQMVQNAQAWAHKALEVANQIQPPQRTEECDMGCAVATHNLGEFAEMNKDLAEAQKKYTEAISLARAIGFQEGVEQSSAKLKMLVGKV